MKYKYCSECPNHIEEHKLEYDDGWPEMDPLVFCKLIMENGKPKFIGDARGFPKPPDWCPQNNDV